MAASCRSSGIRRSGSRGSVAHQSQVRHIVGKREAPTTCSQQKTARRTLSSPLNADVIVLGAGIVGTSTALHLQKRGRSVVLVGRRGAGHETSYRNTGIIQREGVVPYPFPRDIRPMAQSALNLRPEAN